MSYPLALEVKDIKSPPCQVIEETTGRIRCVSPTARHDPIDGDGGVLPFRVCSNTGDTRIPSGIPLMFIPEQSAKGNGIRLVWQQENS